MASSLTTYESKRLKKSALLVLEERVQDWINGGEEARFAEWACDFYDVPDRMTRHEGTHACLTVKVAGNPTRSVNLGDVFQATEHLSSKAQVPKRAELQGNLFELTILVNCDLTRVCGENFVVLPNDDPIWCDTLESPLLALDAQLDIREVQVTYLITHHDCILPTHPWEARAHALQETDPELFEAIEPHFMRGQDSLETVLNEIKSVYQQKRTKRVKEDKEDKDEPDAKRARAEEKDPSTPTKASAAGEADARVSPPLPPSSPRPALP